MLIVCRRRIARNERERETDRPKVERSLCLKWECKLNSRYNQFNLNLPVSSGALPLSTRRKVAPSVCSDSARLSSCLSSFLFTSKCRSRICLLDW